MRLVKLARGLGCAAGAALLSSCGPISDTIFEAQCKRLPPAEVTVTTSPINFTLFNTLSTQELTRQFPPTSGALVLGITKANLSKEIAIETASFEQANTGRVCSRPHVNVTLSLTPMHVFVSSDFAPTSCKYREVYEHEMRHVQVYEEFLPVVSAEIKAQLTKALGDQVHYFSSEEDAQETLDTLLGSMWMPYLDGKMDEAEELQRSVDTPQEYDRLALACPNERYQVIDQSRRRLRPRAL